MPRADSLRPRVKPGDREAEQHWDPLRKEEVNRCWMSNQHIHMTMSLHLPSAHWIPTQPRLSGTAVISK